METGRFYIACLMPEFTLFCNGIDYNSSNSHNRWKIEYVLNPNFAKAYEFYNDAEREAEKYRCIFNVVSPFIKVVKASSVGDPFGFIEGQAGGIWIDEDNSLTLDVRRAKVYPIDEIFDHLAMRKGKLVTCEKVWKVK